MTSRGAGATQIGDRRPNKRLKLPGGDRSKGSEVLRSEEHTSELQSLAYLVCRLLLEKKKNQRRKEVSKLLPREAPLHTRLTSLSIIEGGMKSEVHSLVGNHGPPAMHALVMVAVLRTD